ncbi:MAG: NifU family protein [Candidatus Dormibacteraceae bacterium]
MDRQARREFEERARRVDALAAVVEQLPDGEPRASALEAIQALLELHGEVLGRIVELVGPEAAGRLADDQVVSGLLLLHGVHPRSLEERVRRALDEVRPYLGSHGGGVEVVGLSAGQLHLRLEGSCHGCPSSTATLRGAIEQALADHAPDLEGLRVEGVVEGPASPAGFVALGTIGRVQRDLEWHSLEPLALSPESSEARDVAGTKLLLCRLDADPYAYRDGCPVCGAGLGGTPVADELLCCPGCGRHYDVRHAGRCREDPAAHLEPVPLLPDAEGVRVALPAAGVGVGARG